MYKLLQRLKNIWFWSGISREDVKEHPNSFTIHHLNKEEIKEGAYIVGLTEEESSFASTLNADNRDTKLN